MTNAELEIILSNYRLLEKAYHNERTNILHPYMETDTNTGGSSSSRISNPTASTAIALTADNEDIQKHYRAIQRTYMSVNNAKKRMMEVLYFDRAYNSTLTSVSILLNIDQRTLREWRKEVIDKLKKEL